MHADLDELERELDRNVNIEELINLRDENGIPISTLADLIAALSRRVL